MSKQNRNKLARDMYLENRSTIKGIDMIKANHVKTKDITSDMKLFKEIKDGKTISTFYDRVEIIGGAKTEVIYL